MAHCVSPTCTIPSPELASTIPMDDVLALGGLIGFSKTRTRTWGRNSLRIAEYKRHITTLMAICNLVAPTNTLPNELLMKIFAAMPGLSWYSAEWMSSLGLVSRRWRAVLLATPEYWAKALQDGLDLYNDLEQNHLLPLFVERSSPCPLRLDFFSTTGDEGCFGWEAFEGHQWRISDLQASAESKRDLLQILEEIFQLKRLERLKLEVHYTVSTKDLDLRM